MDTPTGETAAEEVTDIILGDGLKDLVRVGTDPDGDGVTDWVTATDGHPFWIPGRGWIDARNLTLGDNLVSNDGGLVEAAALAVSIHRDLDARCVDHIKIAPDLAR